MKYRILKEKPKKLYVDCVVGESYVYICRQCNKGYGPGEKVKVLDCSDAVEKYCPDCPGKIITWMKEEEFFKKFETANL